ncbi:O-methyltransferase-domain-containing protein [Ephemerocybe angulata]|uniref:O-methyltransferase-domain-containing protein n=1 Tax=Ephemerocybe angulata TaxID=980116 RepID=A0A8H6I826_9AGAR|nr:O-methyltransferase-domain-containing protein [Tulosesus angulatus]
MSSVSSPLAVWEKCDEYHNSFLLDADPAMDAALKNSEAQGLPDIAVSPAQGKFLNLLVKTTGSKRVLEVGTLGGYSTIWLARAIPEGGLVTTLELDPHHAKVATENISNAGVADKVDLIVGPAAESIKKLGPNSSYDFAFIDADKEGNLLYFQEAKRLVKSGGTIIVDNVCRAGRVADLEYSDVLVDGVRTLLMGIEGDKEVEATTISTVGEKGYDGFLYAIRK